MCYVLKIRISLIINVEARGVQKIFFRPNFFYIKSPRKSNRKNNPMGGFFTNS